MLQLDPTSWTGKHTVESGASGDGYQFTLSADGNWNLAITGPATDAYNPQMKIPLFTRFSPEASEMIGTKIQKKSQQQQQKSLKRKHQ